MSSSSVQAKRPGESPVVPPAHRNHGWNVRRRRRGEVAAVSSSEARGKTVITLPPPPPPPPLMHVMKFTLPSVLVFAALRYQGKPQVLPASMWCFVAVTCVYWLIAGEMKRTPPAGGRRARFRIYNGTALASAILSGVLVISMLLPRPVSIWIPLSAGVMLYAAYSLLCRAIRFIGNRVHAMKALSGLPV